MSQLPDLALLERLREVLADQPVTETELRALIDDRPPRVEYRLTRRGERLAHVIALLGDVAR